ncbi:GMC family oxidoreductase N-terminal domain-containing protein [Streptomyces sp. NPDC051665]|uniref:GMC family oxidoreductase n=1 Tax=Streptomyces sp. NPDC051665 TaxID=3154647 RepID=UPI0034334568
MRTTSEHPGHGADDVVDVVIVGGGSAGAVLAARLSADPRRTVLLIEAGPDYPQDRLPEGLLTPHVLADPDHDWGYTARATDLAPRIPAPRGRTMGGSSAVNAGVAIRARAADFAAWGERYGIKGWSYDEVLPTFREMENTPTGDDTYHGRTGPFPVRQWTYDQLTSSLRAFVDSAADLGFRRNDDFNGARQDGTGGYPVNIVDGVRQNTALVYLTPQVRSRPNLTVLSDVTVDKVIVEGGVARGVVSASGTVFRAGEVVLSAGSYGSPAILLRSGVGPAGDLRALGIDVVADLPVGRRLQDHPFFHALFALTPEHQTLTSAFAAHLWLASPEARAGELDLSIVATHLPDGSFSPTGGAILLATAVTRPESRGSVRLAGRDPHDAPVIDNNYLATPRDRSRMLEGVRLVRRLASTSPFAGAVAAELVPGELVRDDAELEAAIAAGISTYGHPTSTAPMGGPGDEWAVVDESGAVHGLTGLRVVDASIMPEVPSTVTNATTIMIAEHISRRVYGS